MLEVLKWVAAGLFLTATVSMFWQHMATRSVLPWLLFLIGNIIWMLDSALTHNAPWLVLSVIFVILDAGLIIQRIYKEAYVSSK